MANKMATMQGCCCEEECISGNEPTAAISYIQTEDTPCTINLFDESTVHANCVGGTIVEWKWYKNADLTPFSTAQNPTGVTLSSGDDIRLWVKDSCGCTDEVVTTPACIDMSVTCNSNRFIFPSVVDFDFGTLAGNCAGITPQTCAAWSGPRVMFLDGVIVSGGLVTATYQAVGFAGSNRWLVQWTVRCVDIPGVFPEMNVFIDGGCTGGGASIHWRSFLTWKTDWRGESGTVPYLNKVGTLCSTYPASVSFAS